MKSAANAVQAGCALIAMCLALSPAVLAAPAKAAPPMTLLSTDAAQPYPFAAIEVGHRIYHVTAGDVIDGVYIRSIGPGRVLLSTDQVLVAGRPLRPEAATHRQVARTNAP